MALGGWPLVPVEDLGSNLGSASSLSTMNLEGLFSHFVSQFSQMEYGDDDVGKGRAREERETGREMN